jgi:phosphate transport system substrate-binding protein
MASRELKDSEKEKGLVPTVIAIDGIAVVVNKQSPADNLTKEQGKEIYTGATKTWSEVLG